MAKTRPRRRIVAAVFTALAMSCGGSVPSPPAAPSAPPSTPAPPPPPPAGVTFGGTWSGTASDSQGDTTVAFSLTQTDSSVTGTVATQATSPNDGSCNSCHRNKSGSVTGTVSGSTLTVTMFFAAGVDGDPTPACSATLTASATMAGERRLTGQYTGADTCEGPFTNGTFAMARQP